MDFNADLAKIKELTDKAQEIVIVTHENPTHDSIGASLALFIGLTGLKKHVTVACPDPMIVEYSGYVGVNKIAQEVSKKNFIISLDYVDGSIEKVSYNISGDKFNLVIEPRNGFKPFSEDNVHFSHAGVSADLIFVVDTIHLGGLKQLYEKDRDLYTSKSVINIDRHPNNAHFGEVNLVDATVSATSELVAQVLTTLNIKINEDIATNLMNSLFAATNNFQSQTVSARTFELAAACMNAGAKKITTKPTSDAVNQKSDKPADVPIPTVNAKPVRPEEPKSINVNPTVAETNFTQPVAPKVDQAPADWLKPKIFKSSGSV